MKMIRMRMMGVLHEGNAPPEEEELHGYKKISERYPIMRMKHIMRVG